MFLFFINRFKCYPFFIICQLKEDSEKFSAVLKELGELGKHIALTGMTSYAHASPGSRTTAG